MLSVAIQQCVVLSDSGDQHSRSFWKHPPTLWPVQCSTYLPALLNKYIYIWKFPFLGNISLHYTQLIYILYLHKREKWSSVCGTVLCVGFSESGQVKLQLVIPADYGYQFLKMLQHSWNKYFLVKNILISFSYLAANRVSSPLLLVFMQKNTEY